MSWAYSMDGEKINAYSFCWVPPFLENGYLARLEDNKVLEVLFLRKK
jgi:hypothetical protein